MHLLSNFLATVSVCIQLSASLRLEISLEIHSLIINCYNRECYQVNNLINISGQSNSLLLTVNTNHTPNSFANKRTTAFRFSQFNDIIFWETSCNQVHRHYIRNQLRIYDYISSRITSVLLFVVFNPNPSSSMASCKDRILQSSALHKYPSLKFLIDTSSKNFHLVYLMSSKFSGTFFSMQSRNILAMSLKNPVITQRKLFKTGSFYQVGVAVYAPNNQFFQKENFANDRHACYTKLLFKSSLAHFCTFDILYVSQLGVTHNVSMQILNLRNKTEMSWIKSGFEGQYFLNNKSFELDAVLNNRSISMALHFLFYFPEVLLYCPQNSIDHKLFLHLQTWAAPFSTDLWTLIVGSLVFATVLRSYRRRLTSAFGMFLRQSQRLSFSKIHVKKLIFASIVGSQLCMLYENMLVSLAVVPPLPKTFQSIKEILLSGYKIIWWERNFTPPERWYGPDLEMRGLSKEQIENAFYKYNDVEPPSFCRRAELLLNNTKVSFGFTKTITYTIQTFQQCMKAMGHHNKCYAVPDSVPGLPIFLDLNGIAREWFRATLETLRESGIKNAWNRWSDFNFKIFFKHTDLDSKHPNPSNYEPIDLGSLFIIFTMLFSFNAYSMFVMIIEKCKNFKQIKVSV